MFCDRCYFLRFDGYGLEIRILGNFRAWSCFEQCYLYKKINNDNSWCSSTGRRTTVGCSRCHIHGTGQCVRTGRKTTANKRMAVIRSVVAHHQKRRSTICIGVFQMNVTHSMIDIQLQITQSVVGDTVANVIAVMLAAKMNVSPVMYTRNSIVQNQMTHGLLGFLRIHIGVATMTWRANSIGNELDLLLLLADFAKTTKRQVVRITET
jgi:hypothetical protein